MRQHIKDFLDDLSTTTTANTSKTYQAALDKFLSYNLAFDNRVLCTFDIALAKDERNYSPKTRNLYLAALRRLITHLDADDKLPANFSASKAVAKFKIYRGRARTNFQPTPKTADRDLRKLLTHFDSIEPAGSSAQRLEALRNRALTHVFFSTGARCAEVCSLRRDAVADGKAAECSIKGKGGITRQIFINPPAQAAIAAYCQARHDAGPALFISHRHNAGHALAPGGVWRIVKVAAQKSGLASNTSPHMIRHFVATEMLNTGVPLEIVQLFLGHQRIDTTRHIYAKTYNEVLNQFVRAYHAGTLAPGQQLTLPVTPQQKADDPKATG